DDPFLEYGRQFEESVAAESGVTGNVRLRLLHRSRMVFERDSQFVEFLPGVVILRCQVRFRGDGGRTTVLRFGPPLSRLVPVPGPLGFLFFEVGRGEWLAARAAVRRPGL